jgi:hypothetical protein
MQVNGHFDHKKRKRRVARRQSALSRLTIV